jgi:protochlorophyllide reductase
MGHAAEPTVIVTGASSGVGLYAAKSLADRGCHVVMAWRNPARAASAASSVGIAPDRYTATDHKLGVRLWDYSSDMVGMPR